MERAFRQVQFEGILKSHEYCKSLIAQAFVQLLIYYMNGKITKTRAYFVLHCNIKISHKFASSRPITRQFMDRIRNHRNLSTKKRFREVCFQLLKEIFLLATRSACVHTCLTTTQLSQKKLCSPSFLLPIFKVDH